FHRDLTVSNGQACTLEYAEVIGNVTVNGGYLVLFNSSVDGNVLVSGGQLIISGSTSVGKDVQINGAKTLSIRPSTVIYGNVHIANIPLVSPQFNNVCGTTVKGDLTLQGNQAAVTVGAGNGSLCRPNTVGSNVQITDSTNSILFRGNTVGGNLYVARNIGETD